MRTKINRLLLILLATAIGVMFIVPLIWMVTISLKSDIEAFLPDLSFSRRNRP